MSAPPPTLKQLEASLEAYFRKKVRLMGGHVVKLAPTEKGVPDRLVMLPGGRMFLVELKADGGRLSPTQIYWHERAQLLGTEVVVLEGWGQVNQWCTERGKDYDPEFDTPKRHANPVSQTPEYRAGYLAAKRKFEGAEA